MTERADEPYDPRADDLFADWLARRGAGEELDFEALCRAQPDRAGRLRELHADWVRLKALTAQVPSGSRLAERSRSLLPGGAHPESRCTDTQRAQGEPRSDVLARLAGRGPTASRYTFQGEVGQGGMGVVLRVWDDDLRRHLAMKVMLGKGTPREKGDTPEVDPRLLARFLEEAQITGQLDHPGIVPVHELGLDAEGRIYFTMKLVNGRTLKGVFDELASGQHGWTQTRVLGLLLKVCEAMAYAHDKGVIHRDLKPANVMVGRYGEVYVMDWGLAKLLGSADGKDIRIREPSEPVTSEVRSERHQLTQVSPDSPLHTMDGDVVGTPAYMSPEQAAGRIDKMGPASDVYSVGAMLYHLLAGHMPFVPPGVRTTNYAVWQLAQRGPPEPLAERAPHAPPELLAICDKAMARDVPLRYPDMGALGADLAAYLENRVVRAYETGAWAEARKWVRRNRTTSTWIAGFVLLLLLFSVVSTLMAIQKDRLSSRLEVTRNLAQTHAYRASLANAVRAIQTGNVRGARYWLEQCPPEARQWEWKHLSMRADSLPAVSGAQAGEQPPATTVATGLTLLETDTSAEAKDLLRAARFAPDGSLIAIAFGTEVRLVDAATGATRRVLTGPTDIVNCIAFSADGERLIAGGEDDAVHEWTIESGELTATADAGEEVISLDFVADGREVVCGTEAGLVRVWEVPAWRIVMELDATTGPRYRPATSDRDGRYVFAGALEGGIGQWDVAHASLVRTYDGVAEPIALALSDDGRLLAAASGKRFIVVWRTDDAAVVGRFESSVEQGGDWLFKNDELWGAWIDPLANRLVGGLGGGGIVVWELASGQLLCQLDGGQYAIGGIEADAGFTRLLTCSYNGEVGIWESDPSQARAMAEGLRSSASWIDLRQWPDARERPR